MNPTQSSPAAAPAGAPRPGSIGTRQRDDWESAVEQLEAVFRPQHNSQRERNRTRTQLALRSAALDLFRLHGLENVTVEAITERAGVSPRTFFNYFPTKEACALLPHERFVEPMRRMIAARPVDELPIVAVEETFARLVALFDRSAMLREQLHIGSLLLRREPLLHSADNSFRILWEVAVADGLAERGVDHFVGMLIGVATVGLVKFTASEWAVDPIGTLEDAVRASFRELERQWCAGSPGS